MKVKINDRLICISPHISTTWDQVAFMQTEEERNQNGLSLILHLVTGKIVKISQLDPSIIDIAFAAHMKYLESSQLHKAEPTIKSSNSFLQNLMNLSPDQLSSIPIRFGISGMPGGIEGLETAFQHNAAQSNAPNLPNEIIEKISSIAKILTNGDLAGFPKPEPHCNCMHCQVARAIHNEPKSEIEEAVTEEDLHFRNWDIQQIGEKLYSLTNPLDPREQYNVFLGSPLGCTCGENNCEHIKAVLST